MEKKAWREKFNDFDGKKGEKQNVYHLPEAAPPPKSSTRAIYISKIGMAAKQHFLN